MSTYFDTKAMISQLKWNFFITLYYETTLEIWISILCAFNHLISHKNKFENYSSIISWFFIATETLFIVFVIGLLFCNCRSKAGERMKNNKHKFGSIYNNIDYTQVYNRLTPLFFIL